MRAAEASAQSVRLDCRLPRGRSTGPATRLDCRLPGAEEHRAGCGGLKTIGSRGGQGLALEPQRKARRLDCRLPGWQKYTQGLGETPTLEGKETKGS